MSTTTAPAPPARPPAGHGRGPSGPPIRRRRRSFGALAAAAVAVVALARFATADSGDDPAAPPRRPSTPAQQVAALEARADARPRDPRGWRDLAAAYLARGAETSDPAFYDLTERALGRADDLAPADPETTVLQGSLALARHQFADALALGTAAREAAPDDPDALVVLIDAQVELGRYDDAEVTLARLLDMRPGVAALSRASYLQQLSGRAAQAILTMQSARDAAEASPGAAAAVTTFLGDLRLSSGDLDRADAAYRAALERSPGLVLAELGRASVLELRGRRAEAIDALTRLTERYPLPAAVALLADLERLEGRTEDADLNVEVARAAFGSVVSAGGVVDLERAVFEADRGDRALAVTLATAAHDARSTIFTADALAWALTRAGRPAEAVPFAEEAVRLGTQDATLRFHAATTFADAGRVDRARAELGAAANAGGPLPPLHRTAAVALADRLGIEAPDLWRVG
jgi:tetratricopeptide (TPR) repeat protein